MYIDRTVCSFLTEGEAIGRATCRDINESILIGQTKSSEQDFAFVLEKLSEVALRAISRGINDPNTARHAVRIIGDLIRQYAVIPDGVLVVGEDQQHIVVRETYQQLLYTTFYQVRHYGAEDISVLATMLESLGTMKRFIPYICSE